MRKQKLPKNSGRAACRTSIWTLALGLSCLAIIPARLVFAQPQLPPPPASAAQQEEADPVAAIEKMLQENTAAAAFVYQREGRPDPFFPFLTQQPAKGSAGGELSGMQRFEPGQLKLVAIIHSAKGPVAMVQDSAGIGYTLRRGSQVGRGGKVTDIVGNKVIIKQEAFSTGKEKEYRTVEMVLTKDGDKKP